MMEREVGGGKEREIVSGISGICLCALFYLVSGRMMSRIDVFVIGGGRTLETGRLFLGPGIAHYHTYIMHIMADVLWSVYCCAFILNHDLKGAKYAT